MLRWDETWHRLREWTNGAARAERLAAQVLHADGFTSIDPSHPLGGPDAGRDALVRKDGAAWLMAVYFPRSQQSFAAIRTKVLDDYKGVVSNEVEGMAFVTNQELKISERGALCNAIDAPLEIYHLERVTTILDHPAMHSIRVQFLGIDQVGPRGRPKPSGPWLWELAQDALEALDTVASSLFAAVSAIARPSASVEIWVRSDRKPDEPDLTLRHYYGRSPEENARTLERLDDAHAKAEQYMEAGDPSFPVGRIEGQLPQLLDSLGDLRSIHDRLLIISADREAGMTLANALWRLSRDGLELKGALDAARRGNHAHAWAKVKQTLYLVEQAYVAASRIGTDAE